MVKYDIIESRDIPSLFNVNLIVVLLSHSECELEAYHVMSELVTTPQREGCTIFFPEPRLTVLP